MKRSLITIIILTLYLLISGVTLAGIKYSKHDLSSGSGNLPYKAADWTLGGTREICVFCHTPHSAKADAPLWNRAAVISSYAAYNSDVLVGLGYPAAEDPVTGAVHVKTRICLSCHDGTIGLGSVANMPGDVDSSYSQIQMDSGGGANIARESVGYIGLDLRDDHPVAIQYQGPAVDPELNNVSALGSSNIWLYWNDGGTIRKRRQNGDFVECTSCHNPHDNTNTNFLVDSNSGSGICTSCHTKYIIGPLGSATPAHDNAGVGYTPGIPAGSIGTTVANVKCMNCHFPHKAGIVDTSGPLPKAAPNPNLASDPSSKAGYYLLTFQEEMSCFNDTTRWGEGNISACHGTNAPSNRNIKSLVTIEVGTAHKVGAYNGRHQATEGSGGKGWLNNLANWHVECQDCHNTHTAGANTHTQGTNAVGAFSPLYGSSGVRVQPLGWPTWGFPNNGSYEYIKGVGVTTNAAPVGVQYEYEVCFKCHTDFAWGNGIKPTSSGGFDMTNQAVEFRPDNSFDNPAFHPVTGTNYNTEGTGSRQAPWNVEGTTMYCSDCHTYSGGSPNGPHGSTNPFILRKTFQDGYGTRGSGLAGKQSGSGTDLCLECHSATEYWNSTSGYISTGTGFRAGANNLNLHTQHAYRAENPSIGGLNAWPYRCVNCHARIPHGFNRKAMIVISADPSPYVATNLGGGKITNTPNLPTGAYSNDRTVDCSSTANGCHQAGP